MPKIALTKMCRETKIWHIQSQNIEIRVSRPKISENHGLRPTFFLCQPGPCLSFPFPDNLRERHLLLRLVTSVWCIESMEKKRLLTDESRKLLTEPRHGHHLAVLLLLLLLLLLLWRSVLGVWRLLLGVGGLLLGVRRLMLGVWRLLLPLLLVAKEVVDDNGEGGDPGTGGELEVEGPRGCGGTLGRG